MARIYNADIYCDACGKAIEADRKAALMNGDGGKTKLTEEEFDAIYGNEHNYDSGEYPKYADDDEEADSPQHCGNHADCLNAEVLPSGYKIGCLIGTSLTSDGLDYLKEAIAEGGEVAEFWYKQFSAAGYDLKNPNEKDDEELDN